MVRGATNHPPTHVSIKLITTPSRRRVNYFNLSERRRRAARRAINNGAGAQERRVKHYTKHNHVNPIGSLRNNRLEC